MLIPFFSKKNQKDFYLGVFLKENNGILMIFLKENNRLELIDREKIIYTNGWESLTNDIDEALYRLEKNLDIEIKKTIFFVYSHLVDEKIGDIKLVYLQKIKQLVKALDLQAMGYVECFEGISYYLEKTEQVSLTTILVEIDKTQLGIFVYNGGRIVSKKILGRTSDFIVDLTEGLEEIKKKSILPARIILYDSDDLDDTATKILSHRWRSDLFVQIPKVDILSEDEVISGLMEIFGEQIKNKIPEEKKEKQNRENLGFLINADIGEKTPPEDRKIKTTTDKKNKLKELAQKLLTIFPRKIQNNFKIDFSGKIFVYIGILIIALGLFINEYFFHKAQLTVYLPTQILEKNVEIDINYRLASASADFSETISTTGKQEIGDKARGEVTVYNSNLSSAETVNKGTLIISPNNLKYVLENEVKIASATGDASSSKPSTSKVSVVAEEIGEAYNLAANTKFSIEGKTQILLAKNDSALSGGSKKQVQTVSKKDREDLKAVIVSKAKKETPSIKVLPEEIAASSLSEIIFNKMIYSKEVGEEGNKLTLQAKVDTVQYLYDKKLFIEKVLVLLRPEAKSNYQLEKKNVSYTINKIEKADGSLIINAKVKAKAIIKVSEEKIKKSLLGKNESKIKEILKNQYEIDGYNFNINQPLPVFKNYLPLFFKNIILENSSL